jgi:uncharacterized protein Veg
MVMARTILDIKEQVKCLFGKEVRCVINRGRNKLVKLKVIVEQVYPSMFVINPTCRVDLDRKSYSYNDVLCGDVKFVEKFN